MSGPEEHEELSIQALLERAMHLAGQLSDLDPAVSAPALELLDHLEAWHREALTRLAMALPPDVMDAVRTDPVVAHLLDVYLGEDDATDPSAVVAEALEEIRPYVHSHGGEMEVASVDLDGGVVTLSLLGSCDGCPSSSVTLTQGVEAILRERWPGFRRLLVEGGADDPSTQPDPPELLQIQSLRRH
ncbi:NifU family protein [soil metagenome]